MYTDYIMEMIQKYSFFGTGKLNRLGFLRNQLISFVLVWILAFNIVLLDLDLENEESMSTTIYAILFFVMLIVAGLISIFAFIQRLHDLNKSGWWTLLAYIPIINIIFILYLLFVKGLVTSNQPNAQQIEMPK